VCEVRFFPLTVSCHEHRRWTISLIGLVLVKLIIGEGYEGEVAASAKDLSMNPVKSMRD
jgi:hypothetical protein